MKLPEYSDDEVREFHPICEKALNSALISLGLDDKYEVSHHEPINGIIPDFVIKNKITNRYLLVIEVKRTPSNVSSTRYKNQAQSYILEAGSSRLEKPYYLLTNLEVSNLFKYDGDRTSVNNQLLEPSPINTGTFADDYAEFYKNLTENFKSIIEIVYEDTGEFILSYNEIINVLSRYVDDEQLWHSAITVIGYEFIRSILIKQRPNEVSSWKNAIRYRAEPKMLQRVLGTIDFKSLTLNDISKTEEEIWVNHVLTEAGKLGDRAWNGDEFASIAHDLLISGREHKGLVPTDEDLGSALVSLTISESEYSNNLIISDPASGSGNLISAFLNRHPNFPSENIWLNDKFKQFQDILTIRFGLKFSNQITPATSPAITSHDIINLTPKDFQKVDIILMNPPYVSGVADRTAKEPFIDKIEKYTNQPALTDTGQIPLEGPFLELILAQVKDGTKLGIVYPESHLFAKGREAVAIRKLLIEKFGLKKIFTYPRQGLFSTVTKGTVVLVGEKGEQFDEIEILNSYVPLEQLDLINIETNNDPYGITVNNISQNTLIENLNTGWKFSIFPEYNKLLGLINPSTKILDKKQTRRGPIGNAGGTDYIFPNKLSFSDVINPLLPSDWLIPAIENTRDANTYKLNQNTLSVRALCPPKEAFEKGTDEFDILTEILDNIDSRLVRTKSSQNKKEKTREEILDILEKSTSKLSKKGTILVPRNLRKDFKIYILEEDMYVSSNFLEIHPKSDEQAWSIVTWLYSVLGQFQLEYSTKPQEGARKMELFELRSIQFPDIDVTIEPAIKFPNSKPFIDFITTDKIDKYWIKQIGISNNDLSRYQNIMFEMITLRNP